MADEDLEAIRRQRMAELQAKHGVRETENATIAFYSGNVKLNSTCPALKYE